MVTERDQIIQRGRTRGVVAIMERSRSGCERCKKRLGYCEPCQKAGIWRLDSPGQNVSQTVFEPGG